MGPLMASRAEDVAWTRLEGHSDIGAARRSAADVARRLGFTDTRVAEVGLVASELATNAVVHASAGALLIRVARQPARADVELLVIDAGPGVADIDRLFTDGVSTRGTLGIGLGAVRRLSNHVVALSKPGQGSILHCTLASDGMDDVDHRQIDGLTRPFVGENVCGDAWSFAVDGARVAIMLADGLGHGELAALAARSAVTAFDEDPFVGPLRLIEHCGRRLSSTRGAAVLAIDLDRAGGNVRWCGVGNVLGRIIDFQRSRTLLSQPGIVGHRVGRLREDSIELPAEALLVAHSDGLTDKWDVGDWADAAGYGPTMLCATLLRAAGLRHDDASVVAVT